MFFKNAKFYSYISDINKNKIYKRKIKLCKKIIKRYIKNATMLGENFVVIENIDFGHIMRYDCERLYVYSTEESIELFDIAKENIVKSLEEGGFLVEYFEYNNSFINKKCMKISW